MAKIKFPHIEKSIEDFLYDEEGNIPVNRVLTIGTMVMILGMLMADEAYAAHRSHSSHRSHNSHRSGYSGGHSSHSSHSSGYGSHSSGYSAPAHSSHNNTAPSLYELNTIHTVGQNDTVNVKAITDAFQPTAELPVTTDIRSK